MSEFSMPWPDTSTPGPTVGDGRRYTDSEWSKFWQIVFQSGQPNVQSVLYGVWNQLAVSSPSANLIRVNTGAAFVNGHIYWNDAPLDLAVASAPAGNVRQDRVVLRGTWSAGSEQYKVRAYIKEGTAAQPPAITQVDNSTWEIGLYAYTVNAAGTISGITREFTYARFATQVDPTQVVGGLDHGNLSGLSDDDHPQYLNNARHTKAIHDGLSLNADTLDGKHATAFQLVDDAAQTGNISSSANWGLPSAGVWSIISFGATDRVSLNLNGYCDVMLFFDANVSGPVGGDVEFTCLVDGVVEQEHWKQTDAGSGVQHLNGHWMVKQVGPGAHYFQVKFKRSGSWGPVMTDRKLSVLVISRWQ